MNAAAEFGGKFANAQNTHFLAIFFTEQGHCPDFHRVILGHDLGGHVVVCTDLCINQTLNLTNLLTRHRLEMGEVKAQALGVDQRSFLGDMLTDYLAQSGMEQMSRGMVKRDGFATFAID